jgi:hypothetical protein
MASKRRRIDDNTSGTSSCTIHTTTTTNDDEWLNKSPAASEDKKQAVTRETSITRKAPKSSPRRRTYGLQHVTQARVIQTKTLLGKAYKVRASFKPPPPTVPSPPPYMSATVFKLPPTVPSPSPYKSATVFKPPPTLLPTQAQISTLGFEPVSDYDLEEEEETIDEREAPKCPTCGLDVSEKLLGEWQARHRRMTIRVQQNFCREHTLQSTKQKWTEQHPEHAHVINIDWKHLNGRLENERGRMRALLQSKNSFFRDQFQRNIVDKGNSRTLMKQIIGKRTSSSAIPDNHIQEEPNMFESLQENMNISVGYYGTRGLNRM